MKYCIKCGKQIEDTSKFCEYCGANVEGNNNQPVQQPMQYQNVQPQQSYEQEKIFYQAKLWRNVEVIISNSKVVVKIKPIFNRSFEEDIIYMKFITAVKTKTPNLIIPIILFIVGLISIMSSKDYYYSINYNINYYYNSAYIVMGIMLILVGILGIILKWRSRIFIYTNRCISVLSFGRKMNKEIIDAINEAKIYNEEISNSNEQMSVKERT